MGSSERGEVSFYRLKIGGGGGAGGAYSGEDAFLENGGLFEEILYIETLH